MHSSAGAEPWHPWPHACGAPCLHVATGNAVDTCGTGMLASATGRVRVDGKALAEAGLPRNGVA